MIKRTVETGHTIYGVCGACKPLPVVYSWQIEHSCKSPQKNIARQTRSVGDRTDTGMVVQTSSVVGVPLRSQYACGLQAYLARRTAWSGAMCFGGISRRCEFSASRPGSASRISLQFCGGRLRENTDPACPNIFVTNSNPDPGPGLLCVRGQYAHAPRCGQSGSAG